MCVGEGGRINRIVKVLKYNERYTGMINLTF